MSRFSHYCFLFSDTHSIPISLNHLGHVNLLNDPYGRVFDIRNAKHGKG